MKSGLSASPTHNGRVWVRELGEGQDTHGQSASRHGCDIGLKDVPSGAVTSMRWTAGRAVARTIRDLSRPLLELIVLPMLMLAALVARCWPRRLDIGLGPEPLVNNVYHKKALVEMGYRVETFVDKTYFITYEFDKKFISRRFGLQMIIKVLRLVFFFVIFRYRALYIYFTGGPLHDTCILWRFEPLLLRIAGIRTVLMPYGGDVQDLLRCSNLPFRHAMAKDYPAQRFHRKMIAQKIDMWTRRADHIIAGCDWVDYLYYWDTLMLGHFSIDTDLWRPSQDVTRPVRPDRPLRILHAPNHRALKGTAYFIQAVEELQKEGVAVELLVVEKIPNDKLREIMQGVDIVADQLIIGWYAMFALEAMALEKVVIAYLRDDLRCFYVDVGLIEEDEIPIVNCSPRTVKETLRKLIENPEQLVTLGKKSREFVEKHHSLQAVGAVFDRINRRIGIVPRSHG